MNLNSQTEIPKKVDRNMAVILTILYTNDVRYSSNLTGQVGLFRKEVLLPNPLRSFRHKLDPQVSLIHWRDFCVRIDLLSGCCMRLLTIKANEIEVIYRITQKLREFLMIFCKFDLYFFCLCSKIIPVMVTTIYGERKRNSDRLLYARGRGFEKI